MRVVKKCVICGEQFRAACGRQITCSKKCQRIRRNQINHKSRINHRGDIAWYDHINELARNRYYRKFRNDTGGRGNDV